MIKKVLLYLQHLIIHKYYVFIECRKFGVPLHLALWHDMSKFRLDELIPHAMAWSGGDGYMRYVHSPEFQVASLLHHHRNKHHWQWWVDLKDGGDMISIPIPEPYLTEMLCDWIASARNKPVTVLDWWTQNWPYFVMNAETIKQIDIRLRGSK